MKQRIITETYLTLEELKQMPDGTKVRDTFEDNWWEKRPIGICDEDRHYMFWDDLNPDISFYMEEVKIVSK